MSPVSAAFATAIRTPAPATLGQPQGLTVALFDVDGVLLASPHERAWREALAGYADPARFTTGVYHAQVACNPGWLALLPRSRHGRARCRAAAAT